MGHQQKAYDKLKRLKVGALYMGMGTGKTRTAIELIKDRLDKGKVNHVLWFCPCSVKTNLKRDIEKHSDNFMEHTTIMGIESISMSDRTYMECLEIVQKHKCFLVVDESNLVKNHSALRTRRIQALSEVCEYKLILNGTPITRNETDLYSQWCILDKRIFGYRTYWSFAANHIELDDYGKLKRVLNVEYLTNKIAPYSVQISKDECLDLPPKVFEDLYFKFGEAQRTNYYETLYELTELVNEWDEATVYRLLTALQFVSSGRWVTLTEDGELEHTEIYEDYNDDPRIQLLEYTLEHIKDEKVIIWCKYHFEIEKVKKLLKKMNLTYREFHGKVPLREREKNIEDFKNKNIQVLLGNKTSGGYGLNLQFCNHMIYYSSDFDWGTTAQSEDRIHRIGQEKSCMYYRLWSDSKIDQMISNCLARKEGLEESIRNALNDKNWKEMLEDDTYRAIKEAKRKSSKRVSEGT